MQQRHFRTAQGRRGVGLAWGLVLCAGLCVGTFAQSESPASQPPAGEPSNPPGDQPAGTPPTTTPATPPATPPAGDALQAAPGGDQVPQAPVFATKEAAIGAAQRTRIARILTRTVLTDLRRLEDARPEDFALATLMLRDVASIDPNDAQTLRRWIEAAAGAGDEAGVIEATRRLVKIDPKDTVAQLRLITDRMSSLQSAPERLEAYERLLKSSGGLDVTVRSRLALDAALLARDMGDEATFVAMLKEATRLDSTNKDAAFLAYAYFSQRVEDEKGRLELLANLLMADPLDASVHVQIRDLLASNGAWEAAERFHGVARRILEARGAADIQTRTQDIALGIARGRSAAALADVQEDLRIAREQQRSAFDKAKENAADVNILAPEDVRLGVPLEEARIAAASSAGDAEAVATAITELGKTTQLQLQVLRDPVRRPEGMDEAMAQEESLAAVYRLTMWRLLTKTDVEFAAKVAKDVQEQMAGDDVRRPIFDAWVAARLGEPDKALELIGPVLESEDADAWAMLARAVALEAKGDTKGAASRLREFASMDPFSSLGAWAWARAMQLEPQGPSSVATELASYIRTIPRWVDLMVVNPDSFQRLSLLQPSDAGVMDQTALTLSLRNLSPVPLSLGADKTMNSRLLVGPRIETPRSFPTRLVEAEVVELNQRLRLNPNEELRVTFLPGETAIGWVTDTVSDQATRLRYRALQGFEIDAEGIRRAGAGCADVNSPVLQIAPLDESRLEPQSLAQRILEASEARIPALLVATRGIITRIGGDAQQAQELEPVIEAWLGKYPTLPALLRTLAVVELPTRGEFEGMAFMDALLFHDPDPMVQRWNLFARVSRSQDPTLTKLLESEDALVKQIATAQMERIDMGLKTISNGGMIGKLMGNAEGAAAGADPAAAGGR